MIRFLQTPGPIKKIMLGGLLTVICVFMVITLIPGGLGDAFGFGGAGQGILAKVGNQEVSVQEVQQRAQQMLRQQHLSPQLASLYQQQAMQQAAQGLVLKKALLAEASKIGVRVTDNELAQELHNGVFGSSLFPNGQFIGQTQYEDFISQQLQMSVPQFEQAIKEDLIIRKLENLVSDGITISDAEAQKEYQQENTKVKFDYAVLSLDSLVKQIHSTEAELKLYFEKNQGRYASAIPEKRKADYAIVDQAKIAEQTQVTSEDLQKYYNQHRDEFRVADEVNLRHILIKTPSPGPDGKLDPKALEAARAKAQEVANQLKAGVNFAELAKKYSEDPGSKDNGGSLGWIGKGRTVPEFEKAAFSLDKGQTSSLVQSSFGFHIIHVDDKRTAHMQSLDQVKSQIEPVVKQQKAAQIAETLSRTIATQARASGGLEAAAAKNGVKVEHSQLFARTDALPGVGNAPAFMDAIFAANAKSPPEAINIPQGYAIFQVTEIKPPAKPTFEEIRDRVQDDFHQERGAALLQQKTTELSDRARAGHDLKKAAKELGATLKTSDLVSRQSQVPDIGAMTGQFAVAFTMKPGEISSPINTGRNGIVMSVITHEEPNVAEYQAHREQFLEQLLQQRRQENFQIFATTLRQNLEKVGKIRYNKQERERIFNQRGGIAGG